LSDIVCVFALTNLPHARDVGGEDLYQWWGVSQWAGRPKQDTVGVRVCHGGYDDWDCGDHTTVCIAILKYYRANV
jgi:hypothetical protein